jgi:hypothetical protein
VPSAPTSLAATAGNGSATLTWRPPTSDGGSAIKGYNIFRNGVFLASTGVTLTYTAGGLTNGTQYNFKVSAYNAVGGGAHSAYAYVTPTSSTAAPPASTSWKLVFSDEFTNPIARGSFASATAGRYYVSKGWKDSSGNGTYSPEIIAVQNGMLDIAIGTYSGVRKVASFSPIPPGSLGPRGDLLGMRVAFRIRADSMAGYKGVPLLWPLSNAWPRDGEIDFPESNFDKRPMGYMHRQGATTGSDQDYYYTPLGTTWQTWHDAVIEWVPGVRCEFFLDGVSIGRSTNRVPKTAMHLSMQFETQVSGGAPSSTVSGHVQIDRLSVWVPG